MKKHTYLFKVNGRYLTYYNHRDKEMRLSDRIDNARIFQGEPKTQLKRLASAFDLNKIEVLELAIRETDCLKSKADLYLPKTEGDTGKLRLSDN